MGINRVEAQAILSLTRAEKIRGDILTLGRPEMFVSARELKKLSRQFKLGLADEVCRVMSDARFAEDFLTVCGFSEINSLDASDYEGADIVHDLNMPIPKHLEHSASFVYDGGTIEHVFDIATALSNLTRLLKPGGTALISTCANGQCGHGFYQFSPELFYRFFTANGFGSVRVYVVGMLEPVRWCLAVDPVEAGKRIQFATSEPLQLIVVAKKGWDLQHRRPCRSRATTRTGNGERRRWSLPRSGKIGDRSRREPGRSSEIVSPTRRRWLCVTPVSPALRACGDASISSRSILQSSQFECGAGDTSLYSLYDGRAHGGSDRGRQAGHK